MRNPEETPGIVEAEGILHNLWMDSQQNGSNLWVTIALYNAYSYMSFGEEAFKVKRSVYVEVGIDPRAYCGMRYVWPMLKEK